MKFKSDIKRQAHPQGKLINAYLMRHVFFNQLTEQELDTLELGIHHLGAMGYERYVDDYVKYSENARYKIFICLLLSNKTIVYHNKNKDLALLMEIGEKLLNLSLNDIAKVAAISNRFDIIKLIETKHPGIKLGSTLYNQVVIQSIASNGGVELFEKLLDFTINDDFKVKDLLITADYLAIFVSACKHGNLRIVKHLESHLGNKLIDAIRTNNYSAYISACESGNLQLVQYLENHLGDELKDAISVDATSVYEYKAYQAAFFSGNLQLVQHIKSHFGNELSILINTLYRRIYQDTYESGNLQLVKLIESHLGVKFDDDDVYDETRHYWTYVSAWASGNLQLVQHLKAKLGCAFSIYDNRFYTNACRSGSLQMVTYLESHIAYKPIVAISSNYYDAYRCACSSGNLQLVQHLENHLGDKLKNAIRAIGYWVYNDACSSGNLKLVQHLENHLGSKLKYVIGTTPYRAYQYACSNGNLQLLQHLENHLGDKLKNVIRAYSHQAYRRACSSGNLQLVQHLENLLGDNLKDAISANDYEAYQNACRLGYVDIVKRLLNDKSCFAYAEIHDQKYGHDYVYDWVRIKLRLLNQKKADFKVQNPDGVFTISDEDGYYYLPILRNLIRRGVPREYAKAEDTHDAIASLLEIPAIKALCHQPVSDNGQKNELLQFAMSIGNKDAVKLLLGDFDSDLRRANKVRLVARENPQFIDDLVKAVKLVPEETIFFIRSAFSSPESFNRLIPNHSALSNLQLALKAINKNHPQLKLFSCAKDNSFELIHYENEKGNEPNIYLIMTSSSKDELYKASRAMRAKDKTFLVIDNTCNKKKNTEHSDSLSNPNKYYFLKERISTFFYSADEGISEDDEEHDNSDGYTP